MLSQDTVIILVNYNGYQDTLACLESISKTNKVLPFVVIVDNNSKTPKELEQLHSNYKKLHIIYNTENVGFGRANNIGIQWAQQHIEFQYVLLLNNDTLIEPNTIEELIKPFALDNSIGITTAKTYYEGNRDIVWYGGGDINYKKGFPEIIDLNKTASLNGANKSRYVSFISGCTMMFSKKSISLLKGFDDAFFMYCEDLELCMRASKLNVKMYYTAKSIVYHKVQGSSKTDSTSKTDVHPKNPNAFFLFRHIRSNQFYTMRKHLSQRKFHVFCLFYLLMLLRTNFIMLVAGRLMVVKETYFILKNNILCKTENK